MKWRMPDQEVDQRELGEVVQKDSQAHKLNRENAMDRSRWRKLTKGSSSSSKCSGKSSVLHF